MTQVPIIETSLSICRANHWTGFYITETSVIKDLKEFYYVCPHMFHKQHQSSTEMHDEEIEDWKSAPRVACLHRN